MVWIFLPVTVWLGGKRALHLGAEARAYDVRMPTRARPSGGHFQRDCLEALLSNDMRAVTRNIVDDWTQMGDDCDKW